MIIQKAEYIASYVDVSKCPPPDKPEYAFIGRSNVGKSSLINALTGRKKLAHVSNTPGKTQTINHFLIDETWYLVDLPGYGYAKISKSSRKKWLKFIKDYLAKRSNLMCVCLLIDSRIPPQKIDLEFANWLGEGQIPFVIVYTKADKSKQFELKQRIQAFEAAMLETWASMPDSFVTSSTKKLGQDTLLDFIDMVNQKFVPL